MTLDVKLKLFCLKIQGPSFNLRWTPDRKNNNTLRLTKAFPWFIQLPLL